MSDSQPARTGADGAPFDSPQDVQATIAGDASASGSPEGGADLRTGATGLGVDIVEISRMEKILQRSPAFATRNFSVDERAYCERHRRPAIHYATHFAAKEAVLKALGTGFSQGIGVTDVEVVHEEGSGRPLVALHGRAREVADERGIVEIALSLSRSNETAVANAVALTTHSRPAVEDKETPRQQLAARFRELRDLLDEMPGDAEEAQVQADPDPGPMLDSAVTGGKVS